MLRVIMLSLVWAICSTCLVRPWFWKGVINKTLVINYEEKRIGFTKSWKSEIVAEIFAKSKGSDSLLAKEILKEVGIYA